MSSHKVGILRTGPVGVSEVPGGGFRTVWDTGLVARGEAGLDMTEWGSQPLSGRYLTGVANRGLAIALGTPMETERE